jgi:hypothetical protein
MYKPLLLIAVVAMLMLVSCNNSTEPEATEPFKIQITLKNNVAVPLEGYRVAIFQDDYQISANAYRPQTSISFELANDYHVIVDITDYFDAPVKTLVDTQLSAGQHRFVWNGWNANNQVVRDGIYKVRARYYLGSNLVFSDLIYAYKLAEMDVNHSPYFTDAQGMIVEEYKIPFPVLYYDRPLPHLGASGELLGDYTFSTATKVLIKDMEGVTRYTVFGLRNGANILNLNWDTMPLDNADKQAETAVPKQVLSSVPQPKNSDPEFVNKLNQNYPNPFN